MDKNSNPTLEKYQLIAGLGKCNMSGEEYCKRLAKIDYGHRSQDSKTLETICRKGGKCLMIAGLLSCIANTSLTIYQNQSGNESNSRNAWMIGSVLLAYVGSELYVRRRKEWDEFYSD